MFVAMFSPIMLTVAALARGEHVTLPSLLRPMGHALATVQSYRVVSESSMSAGPVLRQETTFVRHGKDIRVHTLLTSGALGSGLYFESVAYGDRSRQRHAPNTPWQCQTERVAAPDAARTPFEILNTDLHWERIGEEMLTGQQAVGYRAIPIGRAGGRDIETLWLTQATGLPLRCDQIAPDGASVAHVTWSRWNDPLLSVPLV